MIKRRILTTEVEYSYVDADGQVKAGKATVYVKVPRPKSIKDAIYESTGREVQEIHSYGCVEKTYEITEAEFVKNGKEI